jgi:hypothetical protein
MLPSDYLVSRKRKGRIFPQFAELSEENIGIARTLIETFSSSIGKKRKDIPLQIEGKFMKGLKVLLERRCEFVVESKIDPFLARKKVFERAGSPVMRGEERDAVIRSVAGELGISPEELESSLVADFEEEQVLSSFQQISPEQLLLSYNLSLAQTLLFKATGMEILVDGKQKEILRRVKKLGLMYLAEKRDGRFYIYLDGPLSILKLTERYGTAIAKLLPSIISADEWKISSTVVVKRWEGSPRIMKFEIDSSAKKIFPEEEEKVFDSSVEEKFFFEFKFLSTGWEILREPEPLIAGRTIFIPDFAFLKRGMKVYLEIVGYWTPEYLEKKIHKLSELYLDNLILAVDSSLSCRMEKLGYDVVYFDGFLHPKSILEHLRRYEERFMEREKRKLSRREIHLEGEIIHLRELAEKLGVDCESLRKVVEEREREVKDYVLIGDQLVKSDRIEKIKEVLPSSYSEISSFLLKEGIESTDKLLSHLGYEVEWHGLDPSKAVVRKR